MFTRRTLLLTASGLALGVIAASAMSAEREQDENVKAARERLLGTWKADAERTMKFVDEETRVSEKAKKVLRQLLGKMLVEFEKDFYVMNSPAQKLEGANGKIVDLQEWQERVPYKILGATENTIAIQHAPFAREEITVLHFEDDHYWIYDELYHSREYFHRVK